MKKVNRWMGKHDYKSLPRDVTALSPIAPSSPPRNRFSLSWISFKEQSMFTPERCSSYFPHPGQQCITSCTKTSQSEQKSCRQSGHLYLPTTLTPSPIDIDVVVGKSFAQP